MLQMRLRPANGLPSSGVPSSEISGDTMKAPRVERRWANHFDHTEKFVRAISGLSRNV